MRTNYQDYDQTFKKVYCKRTNKVYWILGSLFSSQINLKDFTEIATDYADEQDVDVNEINIFEILFESDFKFNKVVYYPNPYIPFICQETIKVEDFSEYIK